MRKASAWWLGASALLIGIMLTAAVLRPAESRRVDARDDLHLDYTWWKRTPTDTRLAVIEAAEVAARVSAERYYELGRTDAVATAESAITPGHLSPNNVAIAIANMPTTRKLPTFSRSLRYYATAISAFYEQHPAERHYDFLRPLLSCLPDEPLRPCAQL